MDNFKEKFVNIVEDINKKIKTKDDLINFIKEYSTSDYFYQSIKDLMEYDDIWVRIYAANVSVDYGIEPKMAKKVVSKILKKESFDLYSIEAEFILEKYKNKYKNVFSFFKKR